MYTCNSSTREVREEGHEFEREMNLSYMVSTCLLKNKKKKEEKEKTQTWIQMCRWQTIALGRIHRDMHTLVLPTLSEKRLPPPPRLKWADPDCVHIRTTLNERKREGHHTGEGSGSLNRKLKSFSLQWLWDAKRENLACVGASGSPNAIFLRTGLQKADSCSEWQKQWVSESRNGRSLRQTTQNRTKQQQQQNPKQSYEPQLDDGKTLIGWVCIRKWGKE